MEGYLTVHFATTHQLPPKHSEGQRETDGRLSTSGNEQRGQGRKRGERQFNRGEEGEDTRKTSAEVKSKMAARKERKESNMAARKAPRASRQRIENTGEQ